MMELTLFAIIANGNCDLTNFEEEWLAMWGLEVASHINHAADLVAVERCRIIFASIPSLLPPPLRRPSLSPRVPVVSSMTVQRGPKY